MTQAPDHFKQTVDGAAYAGDHLLVEFWNATNLSRIDIIQNALEAGARAAGATVVHSHYHRFGDGGGVSGVTILAESHMTIHTWPERSYAAIDIFMCGACDPRDSLPALEAALLPERTETQSIKRGAASDSNAIQQVA